MPHEMSSTSGPGFALIGTNASHSSDVRAVLYDAARVTSVDESCIKVWRHVGQPGQPGSGVRTKHDVAFPARQKCFIAAIVASPDRSLLFAACLDNTLKVYSAPDLALRSSCAWPLRGVSALVYNEQTHDLVVASSSHGLQAWSCGRDSAAEEEDKGKLPWSRQLNAETPWNYGRYLLLARRLVFQ